ncbi:Autophagy-related protein 2 [Venturia nashicola]|uniref:Autophagy-related protein 2 n=1 Tax=Venturia nashicola TaxID=86259 RepID=A0A4Z1PCS5_9PEZI|nr:Autophagy-related protein 2 [Venturia nashicola]
MSVTSLLQPGRTDWVGLRLLGQGYFDWNSDLGSEMRKVLETPWTEVTGNAVKSHDTCRLTDELQRAYNQIQKYLGKITFSETWHAVQKVWSKLESLRENVFKKVCGSSKSSYLLENMIPVYRKAGQERGRGMAARQRSAVESQIKTGAIYEGTTEKTKNGPNAAINLCFLQLFAGAYEELSWILDRLNVLEATIIKPDPHRVAVLTKCWFLGMDRGCSLYNPRNT